MNQPTLGMATSLCLSSLWLPLASGKAGNTTQSERDVERLQVQAKKLFQDTSLISPTSRITRQQLNNISFTSLLPHIRLSHNQGLNLDGRYASNSYGRPDNLDYVAAVFGAQDDYLMLGLKLNWQVKPHINLSAGMDNLTSQLAYVAHPWPQRTAYLQATYIFEGAN